MSLKLPLSKSNLFQDVCKLLKRNKMRTPYHPSSNRTIERFNQTLLNMVASYMDKRQQNWDENLTLLTAAYRSSIHESTGFSPNFLMLGREVRTPIEIALGIDRPDVGHGNYDDHANDLATTMGEASRLAREHLSSTSARQKRDYDARLSVNSYCAGDLVYYLDTTRQKGLSPKLKAANWIGPCVITRKLSDIVFEIQSQPKGRRKVLHHDRLKPFSSTDIPPWVRELSKRVKMFNISPNQRHAGTQTRPKDTFLPRRSGRQTRKPDRLIF